MMITVCLYVTLTYYHLTGGNQDNAAFGGRVVPGLTCAVSKDLHHLRNKIIDIEGVGPFYVNDKMGPQATSKIDLAAHKREYDPVNLKRVKVCYKVVKEESSSKTKRKENKEPLTKRPMQWF